MNQPTPEVDTVSRMLEIDMELWQKHDDDTYDKERNRAIMEQNRQNYVSQGLEPYRSKWHHSSQESSTLSDSSSSDCL